VQLQGRFLLLCLNFILVGPSRADLAQGLAAYKAGDFSTAEQEFELLAATGDVTAQKTLAHMYAIGQGVKEDDAQAIAWWTKAAQSGRAEAQWESASEYHSGSRIQRDYTKAIAWYLLRKRTIFARLDLREERAQFGFSYVSLHLELYQLFAAGRILHRVGSTCGPCGAFVCSS